MTLCENAWILRSLLFITLHSSHLTFREQEQYIRWPINNSKWMDNSWTHAILPMLASVKDTGCLSTETTLWSVLLSTCYFLSFSTECAHSFPVVRVCAALTLFTVSIKCRNMFSFPHSSDIPERLILNNIPTKSCIYCMWGIFIQCHEKEII